MPKRSIQHVIGDRAATAVTQIWQSIDAAVEAVMNDYGEDLLVQTSLYGEIDSSRIWVQVKGKTEVKLTKSGSIHLSVPRDHAIKWTNSADIVVVVLWDLHQDLGWYAYPREQVNAFDLVATEKARVTLAFDPSMEFNERSAKKIAWRGRLENARGRLLVLSETVDDLQLSQEAERLEVTHKQISFILWRLLVMVNIFAPEGILEAFEVAVKNACYNIKIDDPSRSADKVFGMAVMLAVLGHISDVAENGLPRRLWEGLATAAENALRAKYGGTPDWIPEIEQLLPDA